MRLLATLFATFLLCVTTAQAQQVMSVMGGVVLTRGNDSYKAVNRAYLDNGDLISSQSDGAFSCVVDNVFVYAGPQTSFQVNDGGIRILEGQVRVLSRPSNGLAIGVPNGLIQTCLLYTSPSPRDATLSRMPSSA